MSESQQPNPPKKPFGCLRVLLVAAGLFVFGLFVIAILVWQAVSWIKNAPEPTMAQYEPLTLSAGEEEDVARVIHGIEEAKKAGTVYDEYITPQVFNGALEKIREVERQKGPEKPDAPLALRGSFVDDCMAVKATFPAKNEQGVEAAPPGSPSLLPERKYVNAETVFDIEIVDGELVKAHVRKLTLRGREAPFLPRLVFNMALWMQKKELRKKKDTPENPLRAIKVLRREGERLHIMLDCKAMAEQEKKKQPLPTPGNF